MTLLNPHATRGDEQPEVDSLVVCGACRQPSVVTLLGTRALTDQELATMPDDVKSEIAFALRVIDAKIKQQ